MELWIMVHYYGKISQKYNFYNIENSSLKINSVSSLEPKIIFVFVCSIKTHSFRRQCKNAKSSTLDWIWSERRNSIHLPSVSTHVRMSS